MTDALSVDWSYLHAYAFPPTTLIPSFCTSQDSTISVQNSSYCPSVAPMSVVFRGVTTISISSNSFSALSKTAITSKGKVSASKSPITRSSWLRVIKQSIRDKKFSQSLQTVSKSRRKLTQKVYDAKWVVYSNWCHRKKVNPVLAPLSVIANFLIFLFSEKKYQISTVKGYRAMISNTLKFKTSNRIGSNPVFSELDPLNYNVQYKDLLHQNGIYPGS